MNETLLNAILNLFAIQTSLLDQKIRAQARKIIELYLIENLRIISPLIYLKAFDHVLDIYLTRKDFSPRTQSDMTADIAVHLKPKTTRYEQYNLLIRYIELAVAGGFERKDLELLELIAEILRISQEQLAEIFTIIEAPFDKSRLTANFLILERNDVSGDVTCQRLYKPEFRGKFSILHLSDVGIYYITATDKSTISLNSVQISAGTLHLLQPGVIIRDDQGTQIYFSEVTAHFSSEAKAGLKQVFRGENLEFRYSGSENGLYNFSFCETGGILLGVMGVSGSGKSTLLSILNGQRHPDSGRVLINDIDLLAESSRLEGVIGYVPQDDLLFEDLTVFENLYYNTSLCMANLDPEERTRRVEAMLDELQQMHTRDLKVGSPLDKTISGGQRKRLNIAMELIREPAILFVDEPTSGLSSSDSENVMALLKAQATKGKLVIVVIHQPSSRIFKMFDKLWVLDQGGRPIYDGNPLDAIVYFRKAINLAGSEDYACPRCGNLNPEQLFEIVELKKVEESGCYSKERQIPPEQWHEMYLEQREKADKPEVCDGGDEGAIERRLWRPGWFGQLKVFFQRNFKGRLNNRSYILINLLEPPLLALFTALLSRGSRGVGYVFMENENLSVYFFISVIVALFLGLSVSAEEINRDRKILVREGFLNLSWSAYIASKTLYLALVSAVQMAMFTAVANPILQVPDMFWKIWLVLFSCAMVSCMIGLIISAAFESAVTIYILIPMLLVPQMMLGGAVIPFDDLIHKQAGNRNTPLVANIMPSRWGYEALAVEQYTSNRYMRHFLNDKNTVYQCDCMINYHIPEMRSLADFPLLEMEAENRQVEIAQKLAVLASEVRVLEKRTGFLSGIETSELDPAVYSREVRDRIREFLKKAIEYYSLIREKAAENISFTENKLREELGQEGFKELERRHYNKDIAELALNRLTLEPVRISGDRLVQTMVPICQEPESKWGKAHFMAAAKKIGSSHIPTLPFNVAVLWCQLVVLYIVLYFSLLPKIMAVGGSVMKRFKR
ncbi:MAG TPA: ATP-binding cassette domain-containing protein [archaeon]|nr:ATP-binding cassette domain-containing protein [archaeon]